MVTKFLDDEPEEPITLDEAKEWLKREGLGDLQEDSIIELLIPSARLMSEQYTGLLFSRRLVESTFKTTGKRVELHFGPDIAIQSATRTIGAFEPVTLTDYDFLNGFIGFPRYWRLSVGLLSPTYKVTYYAGYAEGELPELIKQAIKEIIAFSYVHRGDQQSSETRTGRETTVIPPQARYKLDQYRLNRWELI